MRPDQIDTSQRGRWAYVYIRQSTAHQVMHHRESLQRQRALVDRAVALGWPPERIDEIDEDLGKSAGVKGRDRSGFGRLVADAALGKVGLIVALDASRLARNNRDWYQLLDICAVTGTLIADAEAVYDARVYNDRLLLGLKGTMSEAELTTIKQRLVDAIRHKAARGEFRYVLPAAFVWGEDGRMYKNPDERVQLAVQQVFARFDRLGTVHSTHVSLCDDGVLLPMIAGAKRRIEFRRPTYQAVHRTLTDPLYAGAYVFGKRQVESRLDQTHRVVQRTRTMPRDKWHTLIKDHHEGYVTWQTYERIEARIAANRRGGGPGAPREGEALLSGLILCGRCGRRMAVRYGAKRTSIRYACAQARRERGAPVCQVFGAVQLERAVEELVLEAVRPAAVEVMLEATRSYEAAARDARKQHEHLIERARYEVDLTRRRYEAVDPQNRLVARDLEQRLELALADHERIEEQTRQQIDALNHPLTDEQKQKLRCYTADLPRLWQAPTTRPQDRKQIARCLIKQVVVTVSDEDRSINADLYWTGGQRNQITLHKNKTGENRYLTDPQLVDRVRELATRLSDAEIAHVLTRQGIRTSKGHSFTRGRVANLRWRHGIENGPSLDLAGDDIYTPHQAAALFGVASSTVIRWVQDGLLGGAQPTPFAPWRIRVTEPDKKRLIAADAPAGWLTLKAMAASLGVSQQTILHRLQAGQLNAVRVQTGRRSAWRFQPVAQPKDDRTALFD